MGTTLVLALAGLFVVCFPFNSLDIMSSGWIRFDPKKESDLDKWLETYPPSKISKKDNVYWISVPGKDRENNDDCDMHGFLNAWENLRESDVEVTGDRICELAAIHKVTSGKWLFYTPTGDEVDKMWHTLATNMMNGPLGQVTSGAKVSTSDPSIAKIHTHVTCVYSSNFTNEAQVFELEKEIRAAGIHCPMTYKPDVYTHCGIYYRNEWGIRPTLYTSKYDVASKKSTVEKSTPYKATRPRKRSFSPS